MASVRRPKKVSRAWLEKLCRSLPGTTEDVKWGDDLIFSVGDKMFLGMGLSGEGYGFKAEPPVQQALIERPDIVFAKYVGKHGWVTVQKWGALEPEEAEHLVRWSHRLVFAKLTQKKQREIDAALAAEVKAAKAKG